MKYLKEEEILVIHSEIIDETGGLHGVRDVGLLMSVVNKPKLEFSGQEAYRGIFAKAAVYLESIASYHIFIDGNKRTAIVVAARFLYLNGFELIANNKEVEDFVLKVIIKKLDLDVIAAWFKKYSRKIKR